jgi:uncharacterized protein DUF3455
MRYIKTKRIIGFVVMLTLFSVALAYMPATQAADDIEPPVLPALCGNLQVAAGNEVTFHVYARGVQIYRWDGSAWVFVAPSATLFADPDFNGQVGIHYAGPTWESNSGSKVKGGTPEKCFPDPTAIPWLLLPAVSTNGPGIFSSVTYIQRLNTTGGLAPSAPGLSIGASAEVPYTAEYYFYRAQD